MPLTNPQPRAPSHQSGRACEPQWTLVIHLSFSSHGVQYYPFLTPRVLELYLEAPCGDLAFVMGLFIFFSHRLPVAPSSFVHFISAGLCLCDRWVSRPCSSSSSSSSSISPTDCDLTEIMRGIHPFHLLVRHLVFARACVCFHLGRGIGWDLRFVRCVHCLTLGQPARPPASRPAGAVLRCARRSCAGRGRARTRFTLWAFLGSCKKLCDEDD